MTEATERYRQIAVAVLEELRATLRPTYSLVRFSELESVEPDRIGWALAIRRESDAGKTHFEPAVFVELVLGEEGQPVRYRCWDNHDRETETSTGRLSREALVDALKRLHESAEGPDEQIWRWLGWGGTP
ncbi:MAG: hypothetical protein ACP5HS_12040 [Anaerolineae bacterium]